MYYQYLNMCSNLMKNIKIGCWNIQGLNEDKRNDTVVKNYIKECDCAVFVETWQKENVILFDQLTYSQLAVKSKQGHYKGGITITMKNSLRHLASIQMQEDPNMVWIKFKGKQLCLSKDVYLCVIYIPPAHSSSQSNKPDKNLIWDNLQESVVQYSNQGYVMIIGDLNSRIGSSTGYLEPNKELDLDSNLNYQESGINRFSKDKITNTFGKKLLDLCRHNNLTILNGSKLGDLQGQYTSFQYNGSSVIDYCIVESDLYQTVTYFQVKDLTCVSDHTPIVVCLGQVQSPNFPEMKYQEFPHGFKWCEEGYAEALNLKIFQDKINNITNKTYSLNPAGVQQLNLELQNIIVDLAKCSLKSKKCKTNTVRRTTTNKWYTSSLYVLKCNLLHTCKLLQRSPNDPIIRGNYFKHKKSYKRACKFAKKNYLHNIANAIDCADASDSKEFWRLLNLVRPKSTQLQADLPPMDELIKALIPLNVHHDDVNRAPDLNTHPKLVRVDELDKPISRGEIDIIIKKLQAGKAHGDDLITNQMIQKAWEYLDKPVLKLFNMCLETGVYPESWCKGHIVPVHKSGSKADASNYRPITITSSFGKVFSSILNSRISHFLEVNDSISFAQIGFRKGHRTSDHLLLLKGIIDLYKRKRKHVHACFIDFSSAFDHVWHDGLFFKLHKNGISDKIINLLKSMYSKVKTCVKRGDYVSKSYSCTEGTRQGCSLSPTLFKIYLNDLQDLFNTKDSEPIIIDKTPIGCLMYADDVLLISQSAKGLQNGLNILNAYCTKWRLQINTNKTKTIIFNSKRQSVRCLTIGRTVLKSSDQVNYLGFILTPSGKFKATQVHLYHKACRALIVLQKSLAKIPNLSVKNQLKLFDSIIKPILLYGSEVWGAYMHRFANNLSSIKSMLGNINTLAEKLHSKFCKQILKINKYASNIAARCELGRYPLFISIVSRVLKYYVNIKNRKQSPLVKIAVQLHQQNEGSWYSFVKFIIELTGFEMQAFTKGNIVTTKGSVRDTLNILSQDIFLKELQLNNKLKLLSSIKTNFRKEPYLQIQDVSLRKTITSIRLSCHKLPIETGRHAKIDKSCRLCSKCNMFIGDEYHVLMQCYHADLTNLRNNFLDKIFKINKNLQSLSRANLFKYIMLFTDKTIIENSVNYIKDTIRVYDN